MKRENIYKKVLSSVLAAGLIISLAACGEKNEEAVLEYGGKKIEASSSSDADNNISISEEDRSSGQSLQEFYGKAVKWNEVLNVQNKEVVFDAYSEVPDLPSLNVYEIDNILDDTEGEEEAFVKNLFDSDVEKLDKIQYTNETDFIPHMYKLRKMMNETEGGYMADFSVIDSSYDRVFEWTDDSDYYVHMYKGKYQGMNYGLILAYDRGFGRKTIFFFPVSIKDYYPDQEFKTLMMEGTEDVLGNAYEAENLSNLSEDDVKAEARDFLEDKIRLSGMDSKLTNNFDNYANMVSDMTLRIDYGTKNKDCMSHLSFSDGDYLSTYSNALVMGNYRHNILLAEQKDLAKEYQADHKGEGYDDDNIWAAYQVANSDRVEDVNIVRDGYAVYLEDPFTINYEPEYISVSEGGENYMIEIGPTTNGNNGCIMVTSKGVLGVDLDISCKIVDVTEDVGLLSFEKIKEALKNELEEINLSWLGNADTYTIRKMLLTYHKVVDTDNENIAYMVPAWDFYTFANERCSTIMVNALDGSLIGYY